MDGLQNAPFAPNNPAGVIGDIPAESQPVPTVSSMSTTQEAADQALDLQLALHTPGGIQDVGYSPTEMVPSLAAAVPPGTGPMAVQYNQANQFRQGDQLNQMLLAELNQQVYNDSRSVFVNEDRVATNRTCSKCNARTYHVQNPCRTPGACLTD